jgi:hypothetical protein
MALILLVIFRFFELQKQKTICNQRRRAPIPPSGDERRFREAKAIDPVNRLQAANARSHATGRWRSGKRGASAGMVRRESVAAGSNDNFIS